MPPPSDAAVASWLARHASLAWERGLGPFGAAAGGEEAWTEAFSLAIEVFARPSRPWHVAATCVAFLVMMLSICAAFEGTHPMRGQEQRRRQIWEEVKESIPAVFASTSVALWHMAVLYPLRWGVDAPLVPESLARFLAESLYWMVCFEVFVYGLHRFLHWRSPIDMYMLVHGDHHVFKHPTAFASQAIHPVEAILFAETSLIASVFLFPISILTQYVCGILLLVWSIAAHDSRFPLDKGAHYEHHSHPHTNLGFLGVMDVLCGSVWWGYRYDGQPGPPGYVARLARVHKAVFGGMPPPGVGEKVQ